jgi:hypothetical protein
MKSNKIFQDLVDKTGRNRSKGKSPEKKRKSLDSDEKESNIQISQILPKKKKKQVFSGTIQ